jgi:hypothetical protein
MDVLAAALFALFGVGSIAYGVIVLLKGRHSLRWPSVQGQMIVSQVRLVEWEDGAAIWPEIEYEYGVSHRTFTGKGIAFGHTANLILPGEAERIVGRYPAGEPVTVHYNPACPQEAVLEQGTGCGAYVALVIGILFIIAGMWVGAWAGIRG